MVHDDTGYDNWYHEITNHMSVSANYVSYAIESIERNDYSIVEIVAVLKKSELRNKKVFAMLREDYIERQRLEAKKTNNG